MSISVKEVEIKIDGKRDNYVLEGYKDEEGTDFLTSFQNGYYPLFRDEKQGSDQYIIGLIMEEYPDSEIFYRIVTEYGEVAYKAQGGTIKQLKKIWI